MIELLVVILIIALLLGILLPALSKARQAAKVVGCAANQRSIAQTFHAYAADNKDEFPPGLSFAYKFADIQNAESFSRYAGTVRPFISAVMPHYISAPEIFYCPENNQHDSERGWYRNDRWELTYAELGYLMFQNVYRTNSYVGSHDTVGRSPEKVTQASDLSNWPILQDITPIPGNGLLVGLIYNSHADADGINPRGANVAFVDGHVAWSDISELTHIDVGAYYELPPVSP